MKNMWIIAIGLCSLMHPALSQNMFESSLYSPELVMSFQQEIGLDPDQTAQVYQYYGEASEKFSTLKLDLQKAKRVLKMALDNPNTSKKDLEEAMNDLLLVEDQIKRVRFKLLVNIKEILTDSQEAYLDEHRDEGDNLWSPDYILAPIPDVNLRIRNNKSLNDTPLFLVTFNDQLYELPSSGFGKLDTSMIKSLYIYKNPEATRLYGERADNGVVLIDLKTKTLPEMLQGHEFQQ